MPGPTPRDIWELPTRHVGRRVLVYGSVDSTSTVAAALPDPAGVAVLADRQTAGRGQYGRAWHSPPGAGVWLSVAVAPPPELRRPALLTAWAAVAVAEVVHASVGRRTRIKWPNDVLLDGRKVCGILIEQRQGDVSLVVAGIGLNLNQTADEFAAAGLPEATSLALGTGQTFDRDAIARRLLERLDGEYDALLRGERAALESGWADHVGLVGRWVVADGADGAEHRGRLKEMTFAGLELQNGGAVRRLAPELVRALRAASEPEASATDASGRR